MEVDYKEYLRLVRKFGFKYFYTGLPFASIRIFSKDVNGIEHSIVLTHKEFIKEYGRNAYFVKVVTDGSPEIRLNNVHPWQEYEDFDKLQLQLKEKEEALMEGLFD